MNITCIINQKGGVGKTTTAVNLSAGLALQNKKVILIDLDPQYNSTSALGIDPESLNHCMHSVLQGDASLKSVLIKTAFKNLILAPGNKLLKGAEEDLISEYESHLRIKESLKGIDSDHIIIDCSPSLGMLTKNAIFASNNVLVPTELSSFSIEGIANIIEPIVKEQPGKKIGIIITRYKKTTSKTNEWATEELKPYSPIIFKTRIRNNESLNQSFIENETIFSFSKNSNGAKDYRNLTKEYLQWVG